MSADRDELHRLVDQVPESEVPILLAEARRHLAAVDDQSWPPAFFGAGRSTRTDVAARSEEILHDGFGRPA